MATAAPFGPVTLMLYTSPATMAVGATCAFMLRMLSVPPRAIGFPSSPVTVRPTALAPAGAMAPAAMAVETATRALRLLRYDVKRDSLP
jgi:hypothetical protein